MFYLSSHLPVWQCARMVQRGHRVEVGPNWVKAHSYDMITVCRPFCCRVPYWPFCRSIKNASEVWYSASRMALSSSMAFGKFVGSLVGMYLDFYDTSFS
jgi:hypothetical protein